MPPSDSVIVSWAIAGLQMLGGNSVRELPMLAI